MKQFKEKYLDPSKHLKILDLGSLDVNGTYQPLFKEPNWDYCGADASPGKNVDIVLSDPYDWNKIKSNTYDIVISGQTFEHIEYFWITSLQINRILKIGSLACIIAPAGGYEHRYPIDCWRFYPDGMISIAKWAKLEVVDVATQWFSRNYAEDDSDLWMDSMLVCRKTRDFQEVEKLLEAIQIWIKNGLNSRPFLSAQSSFDVNELKRKQLQSQALRTLFNLKESRELCEAIIYLLATFYDRPDLQDAYPEVANKGDMSRLFNWAMNYGAKEDAKLSPYYKIYEKYAGKAS